MLGAVTDIADWATVGIILGGVGYAAGQFFSSRRRAVSDSLKTALDEVEANKLRAGRLAEVAAEKSSELAEVKLENQSLRSILVSGGAVSQDIVAAIDRSLEETKVFVHAEHEKTRAAIRDRG